VSQWKVDQDLTFQTTLYSDIQGLESTDYNTRDRIHTFGMESAVIFSDTTFALSARNVNFENNSAGSFTEWPAHFGVTQAFRFSSGTLLKGTLSGDYLSGYAIYAGGRVSGQFPISRKKSFFSELQATPKFPSIQDRLYVLPAFGYQGNPDLIPEQVYSWIIGYEDESSLIKTRTQIKAEHRVDLILSTPDFSTMMNSGSGNFLSLSHSAKIRISKSIQAQGQILASYSKLDSTGRPYPRLPGVSTGGILSVTPNDAWGFQTQAKWMGDSTESDGSPLANYFLIGEKVTFALNEDFQLALGVDNLLDSRAEAIRFYPLPGRMVYASTEIRF
jgi:outer membrane cobalamin receptor